MFFQHYNPIRIHDYPNKGWVVEIQEKTWYGRKYWTHLISASGLPETPWYYSSYKMAESEAIRLFKYNLWFGSQHLN